MLYTVKLTLFPFSTISPTVVSSSFKTCLQLSMSSSLNISFFNAANLSGRVVCSSPGVSVVKIDEIDPSSFGLRLETATVASRRERVGEARQTWWVKEYILKGRRRCDTWGWGVVEQRLWEICHFIFIAYFFSGDFPSGGNASEGWHDNRRG